MSVLIKGMKMPRNCRECKIKAWEERYNVYECPFGGILELSCLSNGRQDDCPLVELPEKHGRLIDADALMDIFADRLVKVSVRYGVDSAVAGAVSGAMTLLDVQPKVIEAEGE